MEKFAVDLEKVLNEFEYNEECRESEPASLVRTPNSSVDSLGVLRQQQTSLPPAAFYRKPSFERINLADANFAASPPKSSGLSFNHGLYERQHENVEVFSYSHKPQTLNNKNYDQQSSLNNDVNINKQVITEAEGCNQVQVSDWQKSEIPVHSDEKPDLLEYNIKSGDSDLNDVEIHNQLPDITTSLVRNPSHNANNNEIDNLSNSLDLISSANVALLNENSEIYFVSNNQENNLKSEYLPTFNERLVEISDLVTPISNECTDFLPSTDYSNLQFPIKVITEENTEEVYVNSDGASGIDSQICSTLESDSEDRFQKLNENSLDLMKNNRTCDNKFESNEVFTEKLGEYQVETVSEDKTKDCIIKCDEVIKTLDQPKVIGFGIDEELSQIQLLEYLESIDKECDGTIAEQVSLPEKFLEVHDGNNIKVDKTNCNMGNVDKRVNLDTYSNKNEDTIETPKINLPSINSLEAVPVNDDNLSTNISSQNGHEKISRYQSDSLPQGVDCKIKSKKSNFSDGENTNKDNILTLDYKNELEKSKCSVKHKKSEKNKKSTRSKKTCNEERQEHNEISSNTVQAIKVKSKNPFDQDYDHNISKLDDTVISKNPFEDSTENPFIGNTGNPFDETDDASKEDDNGKLCEEISGSNVSQHYTHFNHLQEVKSVDVGPTSVNDSAFNKTSTNEVAKVDLEYIQNKSLGITESSGETALNVTDVSESSNSPLPDSISVNTNTGGSENLIKKEYVSGENLSEDCTASSSSLDSEPTNNSAKMIPIKQGVESSGGLQNVDEAGIPADEDRPLRPNSLELPQRITVESSPSQPDDSSQPGGLVREVRQLGKVAPFWIPDDDTTMCMQCQMKFNVLRRRHHCRACGQVLCYKCCGLKARLEYLDFEESRVCQPCFAILEAVSASESTSPQQRRPNPNNPMEYCSTIPPLQQAKGALHQPPPSVMVPVGVLKREGRIKSDVTKQVMFSDGIRPGGDLTELDGSTEPRMPFRRSSRLTKRVGTPPGGVMSSSTRRVMDTSTHSFIPAESDNALPPVVARQQGEVTYLDLESPVELNQPVVKFAINRNLFVSVKRVMLDCCVNRECWCCSSEGLACVGQDEVVFLLECLPQETLPPKDVFLLINTLYQDAAKGSTVSEMSFTPAMSSSLLGSRDHGGFLYIRTSYQCTSQLALPNPPYLVAVLVHRWETPWARLFPIRLMLRLGAEFRYYPCPLVSVRNRPPLYTDIGHTIINILADFRKYSYTLPSVRGLVIHMEDRQTTINIPRNRYDQVVRALNNSDDSVLAFGANLSLAADSHLVCMQASEDENTTYNTQAINIHNKPRKVTGASFVVFNGALKVPGLAGKSSIVEDGLMVQVPSETMSALRTALRDMRVYCIGCGPNAEETVLIQWTADDTNFNIGVKSCIDGKALDGVPSIRVHNGTDYSGGLRLIRWTEVFILQCEDSDHSSEPLDISRLSESIARATCLALVPLLDLLSAATLTTLSVRTTIHPDNVGYEAGSNGEKLPPLYMKSLDNELVAVVHQAALASQENPAVLELVFRIMEQG